MSLSLTDSTDLFNNSDSSTTSNIGPLTSPSSQSTPGGFSLPAPALPQRPGPPSRPKISAPQVSYLNSSHVPTPGDFSLPAPALPQSPGPHPDQKFQLLRWVISPPVGCLSCNICTSSVSDCTSPPPKKIKPNKSLAYLPSFFRPVRTATGHSACWPLLETGFPKNCTPDEWDEWPSL